MAAIASATVEVTARLDKLDARLREGSAKVEGFVKKHSRSFDLFGAGIRIGAIVGAVKSITSITEAAIRALRGEFDLIDEALRRLPFGIGETVKGIQELWRAIQGAPGPEAIANAAAEQANMARERAAEQAQAAGLEDQLRKQAAEAQDKARAEREQTFAERRKQLDFEEMMGPNVPTNEEIEKRFFPRERFTPHGNVPEDFPSAPEGFTEAERTRFSISAARANRLKRIEEQRKNEELLRQAIESAEITRAAFAKQMAEKRRKLDFEEKQKLIEAEKAWQEELTRVEERFTADAERRNQERADRRVDAFDELKKRLEEANDWMVRERAEQAKRELDAEREKQRALEREAERHRAAIRVGEIMRRLPIQDRRSTAGFGDSGPRSKVDIAGDGLTALKRMQNQMKKDLNTRGVLR